MNEVNISIVVANYNNSRYLKDFFDSIKNSTYYPKEIVFVDDCSTDGSLDMIGSLEIKNLKLISLKHNVGFSNALNIGVAEATCKYILRVDPDDYIASQRIEKQFYFMEAHPEIDILGSNCNYFNESSKRIVGQSKVKADHNDIVKCYENAEHGMIHGTIICKSNILKEIKYFQESYPAEEYDIFSRLALKGYKFHNLEDILLIYRIHKESISNKMPLTTIKKIFYLNERYFDKKNSTLKLYRTFIFLRNYRNFLAEENFLKKYFYIVVCGIVKPKSIFKRIMSIFLS
jgi:GT2 family glycosyltransferase